MWDFHWCTGRLLEVLEAFWNGSELFKLLNQTVLKCSSEKELRFYIDNWKGNLGAEESVSVDMLKHCQMLQTASCVLTNLRGVEFGGMQFNW